MASGLESVIQPLINTIESLLNTGPSPLWPPYSTPGPNWTEDSKISACLDKAAFDLRRSDPQAFAYGAAPGSPDKGISLAIVNLSDSNSPKFGHHLGGVETSVFSIAKLAAMYAAFQLRSDLRYLAQSIADISNPADMPQRLSQMLSQKWSDNSNPQWIQAIPTSPPQLGTIFDFTNQSDGWHIDFATTSAFAGMTDAQTFCEFKRLHQETEAAPTAAEGRSYIQHLGFRDLLRMMIGFSDNSAASYCIDTLGFPFIAALLQQTGLFDPTGQSGLWLASNYAGTTWTNLVNDLDGNQIKLGGTALSLAKFFTLLYQGRLVNNDACTEMKQLMQRGRVSGSDPVDPCSNPLLLVGGWRFTKCFFVESSEDTNSPIPAISKIGIGHVTKTTINGQTVLQQAEECDAALITHNNLTYVAVALRARKYLQNASTLTYNSPPMETIRAKIEGCLS